MVMSLTDDVRAKLEYVAHEVFETFASDGHLVGVAVDTHHAFREEGGEGESTLTRYLVRYAARRATNALGDEWGHGNGNSRHMAIIDGSRRFIFRIRTAQELEDGTLRILATGDPFSDLEIDALIHDEAWVFAFVRGAFGGIETLLAAEVQGKTDGKVEALILGPATRLTGAGADLPPDGGFRGDDEDLADFSDGDRDDDDDLGGLEGGATAS